MKFIVKDGIHVFESLDSQYLIIRDYVTGRVFKINNQTILKELLIFLKNAHEIKEIFQKFTEINKNNLIQTIEKLVALKILIKIFYVSKKDLINVAIIGIGTTGSHIASDLKNLKCINKLVLVDPDKVDISNIYRQNYDINDIDKFKVDVMKKRGGLCRQIEGFKILCDSSKKIEKICVENKIDIVIQAGDFPSSRELAKLTEKAANKLSIPYITNSGYISQIVSLPEFYYPNNEYDFNYGHKIFNESLVFLQANDKASYRFVANVGHVVARQVLDYYNQKLPFKYGERGFFDIENLEWKTERVYG